MKYLLDTHVMLWLFGDRRRIARRQLSMLADPQNEVYVSAASTWEVAIKVAIGKLKLPDEQDAAVYLPVSIRRAGLAQLPITAEHTYAVASLARHHNDPFDRLLVAQARAAEMTIVTNDRMIAKYDVPTMMIA